MFNNPRVNVYESDAGFSIEILGRVGMEYKEGDKIMFVESEIGISDTPTIAIWQDELRTWKPPYDKEVLTDLRRMEILKNICSLLKWRNIQVEIHSASKGWVKGWLV
jgi:hypothetical protein